MKNPNRLINEKSPYLLQHSYNPVNWFPWSDEAFGKAKQEDKPIFLSIGYSTCHWCHVNEIVFQAAIRFSSSIPGERPI